MLRANVSGGVAEVLIRTEAKHDWKAQQFEIQFENACIFFRSLFPPA